MGIREPQSPPPFGDDCSYCTGDPPKLFLPGHTPKYIYLTFHNLIACPVLSVSPPNGKSFKLTQDLVYKCKYRSEGSVWIAEFWFRFATAPYSVVSLNHVSDGSAFSQEDDPCPFEFFGYQNYLSSCVPGVCCYSGYCVVSWNSIPRDLMEGFGIEFSDRTFYEPRVHPSGDMVHKFSCERDATDIKIRREI